jgi:hypothetical protein
LNSTPSARCAAWTSIALGCGLAGALAPHDSFFLPNFAFYWGGQLAAIALLFLARPRAAAVAALAMVLATTLLAVDLWVRHRAGAHPDGLAWLLYPVVLFGAAVGSVGATWWYDSTVSLTNFRLACITGLAAAGGCCLSAALACSSAFYCH